VFGKVGRLRGVVDGGGRVGEVGGGGHGRSPPYLIRLSACDCGLPRAAWVSARKMPRRASSILKSLWPKPRASRSTVSAARRKFSRVVGAHALAVFAGCQHARLEGGERDAHVRGMRGDAVLARPQDRVHPIDPFDRRTAAARLALIAWRGRIVEIEAARALQEVTPGGSHVPQLLRGAGENRTAEQWIACLD